MEFVRLGQPHRGISEYSCLMPVRFLDDQLMLGLRDVQEGEELVALCTTMHCHCVTQTAAVGLQELVEAPVVHADAPVAIGFWDKNSLGAPGLRMTSNPRDQPSVCLSVDDFCHG